MARLKQQAKTSVLREAISTLLPEVRRRVAFFKKSQGFAFRLAHYRELEASLVELDCQLAEAVEEHPPKPDLTANPNKK